MPWLFVVTVMSGRWIEALYAGHVLPSGGRSWLLELGCYNYKVQSTPRWLYMNIFLISVNIRARGHCEHDNQCVFKLGEGEHQTCHGLTHVLLKCLHRNEAISVASQIGRVFQQGSGIFLRDWHCPILRQKDMFSRSKKHQTTNFLMFGVGFYPDIHETLESFAGHVSLDCDPRKTFWSNYGNLQQPRWKS